MKIGRKHELSEHIQTIIALSRHGIYLNEESEGAGMLLDLARLLADHDIANIEELRERLEE